MLQSQSQVSGVEIVWGPEEKGKVREPLKEVFGMIENDLYAIKNVGMGYSQGNLYTRSNKFLLERYDARLNLASSVPLDMKAYGSYRGMLIHGQKLWLFTSEGVASSKDLVLSAREVHPKTLIPSKKAIAISQASKTKWYKNINQSIYGVNQLFSSPSSKDVSFLMEQSKSGDYLAVLSTWPYEGDKENKENNEALTVQVFDQSMQAVMSRDVVLPWEKSLFDVLELRADEKGNAYLLGIRYEGKRRMKREGQPNYEYILLKIPNEPEDIIEYNIRLKDRFVTDMTIAVDDLGNIAAAGFYSDKPSFNIQGTYYMAVDGQSKGVIKSATKSFDIDFITEAMTEREAAKTERKDQAGKDLELKDMALRKLSPLLGGGWILVGEQYKTKTTTTNTPTSTGSNRTDTRYHYHYDDIIVVRISNEGIIEWAHKIPKRQHTVDDHGFYSSFIQSEFDDKLYFVFNDNAKNLKGDDNGKYNVFRGGKGSVTMMVEIDARGNMKRDVLFSFDEAEVTIRPRVSSQIDPKTTILGGQRGKSHRLMKIGF